MSFDRVIALPALLILLSYSALCQAAKIQGVVIDDSGKPVAGIYAVATAQSATDHSTYSSVTNSKGEYSFDALPPGKYSICIQSPGGPQLNNCQWAVATQATVAAAQTLGNQAITVTQGGLLKIRLDDPKQLIAHTDDILIGIYLPSGLFHPCAWQPAIPPAAPTRSPSPENSGPFSVISTHLQMTDDKSKNLAPQSADTDSTGPVPAISSTQPLGAHPHRTDRPSPSPSPAANSSAWGPPGACNQSPIRGYACPRCRDSRMRASIAPQKRPP